MNKSDLINEVAKVVSSKKEAQAAVDCIFSNITEALRNKETVQISGFGSFKVRKREARKGRHPLTGEEIHIEARMAPKFVSGKALKNAVK